jgi:multiple sugar transport system ATP-binding protein
MSRGQVQQLAAPRELYQRPANLFVAEFFGSPRINVVPAEALGLSAPREGMVAGVRAEHLTLHQEPGEGRLGAQVYLVEPMGAESWVTLVRGQEKLVVRAPFDFVSATGSEVWLEVDRCNVHWFSRESGLCLAGA